MYKACLCLGCCCVAIVHVFSRFTSDIEALFAVSSCADVLGHLAILVQSTLPFTKDQSKDLNMFNRGSWVIDKKKIKIRMSCGDSC